MPASDLVQPPLSAVVMTLVFLISNNVGSGPLSSPLGVHRSIGRTTTRVCLGRSQRAAEQSLSTRAAGGGGRGAAGAASVNTCECFLLGGSGLRHAMDKDLSILRICLTFLSHLWFSQKASEIFNFRRA